VSEAEGEGEASVPDLMLGEGVDCGGWAGEGEGEGEVAPEAEEAVESCGSFRFWLKFFISVLISVRISCLFWATFFFS